MNISYIYHINHSYIIIPYLHSVVECNYAHWKETKDGEH